jgi:hypothetical protein
VRKLENEEGETTSQNLPLSLLKAPTVGLCQRGDHSTIIFGFSGQSFSSSSQTVIIPLFIIIRHSLFLNP